MKKTSSHNLKVLRRIWSDVDHEDESYENITITFYFHSMILKPNSEDDIENVRGITQAPQRTSSGKQHLRLNQR